jgi:hypothetical protein
MDFYLDANLPFRGANALNALEEGEEDNVYHTGLVFGQDIKDLDLFPKIKENNGILITNDLKQYSRKNERDLIKDLGITVILFHLPKGANFVLKYKTIIDRWEEIKTICRKTKHPFFCKIKMRGETEIC